MSQLAADGRSIAEYVVVLVIEDLRKGKPVLRANVSGRKPAAYEINLHAGLLSRKKLEARAKAERYGRSGRRPADLPN